MSLAVTAEKKIQTHFSTHYSKVGHFIAFSSLFVNTFYCALTGIQQFSDYCAPWFCLWHWTLCAESRGVRRNFWKGLWRDALHPNPNRPSEGFSACGEVPETFTLRATARECWVIHVKVIAVECTSREIRGNSTPGTEKTVKELNCTQPLNSANCHAACMQGCFNSTSRLHLQFTWNGSIYKTAAAVNGLLFMMEKEVHGLNPSQPLCSVHWLV